MAYQRSTFKLVFADPDLEGLEVKAKRLSVRALLDLAKLRDRDWNDLDVVDSQLDALCGQLVKFLLAWNLEDEESNHVPLTADGLMGQDLGLLLGITSALLDASAGVSPPLSGPSKDGVPSLEESIPMEAVS